MSALLSALQKYVAMRRGMGFKFRHQEKRLTSFVRFMEEHGATVITNKLAIEWATLPKDRRPSWALRLTDVRGFARHLQGLDAQTEVPPTGILPGLTRAKPYIYTDMEIETLLAAALDLPPVDGLRRWTYHCLFGLLSVTGLRISEALSLHCGDVDLKEGVLTIRDTKFGKSRLVPLHMTSQHALAAYAQRRDAHLSPTARSQYFFVTQAADGSGASMDLLARPYFPRRLPPTVRRHDRPRRRLGDHKHDHPHLENQSRNRSSLHLAFRLEMVQR